MIIAGSLEASLLRSVIISLFTWRRAGPDDQADDDERYGWWGDTYPAVTDDRIGSRLWLLRRVKLTAQTQRDAEFYAREALLWLIEDGHVQDIEILTERVQNNRLNLGVVLVVSNGQTVRFNPSEQWQVIYAV
ncbi:phage GP46 family protein [Pseudomonas lijiangensis]|uniref:Phage GP46 family protein n=1 Tax=Pseudomonas lijiangensis TaxID=2995658 RepID=A0ABX8HR17_9PSED|nr:MULTISPECIES: phage GP46 family protein [Pseudomonas syringae group]MBX8492023.1 phage GP46 family protein [Pseudomonas cichorii]MBX8502692.1 phage GP46 family protein [Pseudomonas lijiangensis]MBX8507640.1 phage GP46 family protein [Pseudomonas lijiangensis]MBX8552205.1 phage GP46 family protein [Pseudomonas cichorii]MBX8586016.1 phage GP46 family protein [Pseudomonas cichorii]